MSRLVIKVDNRKIKRKGESIRLGNIRKFDQLALDKIVKSLSFSGLPFGVHLELEWVPNDKGLLRLYLSTRIGARDRNDRRKSIHVSNNQKWIDNLPKGRYIPTSLILNCIRASVIGAITHEFDEFMKLDGHRVFDPHTRTGRNRVSK